MAKVRDVAFPKLLDPLDDLPPTTVITHVSKLTEGKVAGRGTTADNGVVKKVVVNGREARPLAPNFAEWEVVLVGAEVGELTLSAHAEDAAARMLLSGEKASEENQSPGVFDGRSENCSLPVAASQTRTATPAEARSFPSGE